MYSFLPSLRSEYSSQNVSLKYSQSSYSCERYYSSIITVNLQKCWVQTAARRSVILTESSVASHNPSVNCRDNAPESTTIFCFRVLSNSVFTDRPIIRPTGSLVVKRIINEYIQKCYDARVFKSHAGWWYAFELNLYQKGDKWHALTSNSHRWNERYNACTTEQNSLRGQTIHSRSVIVVSCHDVWILRF